MSSANAFTLDQSEILSSGNGLKEEMDLKLPTVNPLHAKWVANSVEKLKQNRKLIQRGWINAGNLSERM